MGRTLDSSPLSSSNSAITDISSQGSHPVPGEPGGDQLQDRGVQSGSGWGQGLSHGVSETQLQWPDQCGAVQTLHREDASDQGPPSVSR